MRGTGRYVGLALLIFAAGAQTPEQPIVRITVKLVQVDAVVTDSKGNVVPGLGKDDFEIFEDGKKQSIAFFSFVDVQTQEVRAKAQKGSPTSVPASRAPIRREDVRRTIVLVVDDLNLSFENMAHARRGLKTFLSESLQPGDLVAIVKTSSGGGALLQQFTTDREQLIAAADRLRWNPAGNGPPPALQPMGADVMDRSLRQAGSDARSGDASGFAQRQAEMAGEIQETRDQIFVGGTLNAVRQLVDGLRYLPGRKVVVLLSDNIPMTSQGQENLRIIESLRKLTDHANRAAVVLYAIDTRGVVSLTAGAIDNPLSSQEVVNDFGPRHEAYYDSQRGMEFLVRETGGLFLASNSIAADLGRISADSSGYYLIGYHPPESTFASEDRPEYHKIAVRVKRKGLQVRSRRGFFGVSDGDGPATPVTRQEQLLAAMISPFQGSDVPIQITPLYSQSAEGRYQLRCILFIDARGLGFRDDPEAKTHAATLDILATTYGDQGRVVDTLDKTYTIRLQDVEYAQALQRGFLYAVDIPLKSAGAYQLRLALRDAVTGKVGSASQFVQIPDLGRRRLALSSVVLQAKQASDAADGSPAVRRFRQGEPIVYGLQIFHASSQPDPKIKTQVRVYRDGSLVHESPVTPFEGVGLPAQGPIAAAFETRIPKDLTPGQYTLEVVVIDELARKYGRASQWTDFSVVQ